MKQVEKKLWHWKVKVTKLSRKQGIEQPKTQFQPSKPFLTIFFFMDVDS